MVKLLRRFLTASSILAVVLTMIMGGNVAVAAPAHSSPPIQQVKRIVLLGDSYASGVGAGTYVPADSCFQSQHSYGVLYAATLAADGSTPVYLTNKTCSGATVASVRASQLSSVKPDTTDVLISIGGNDLGFSKYVAKCLAPAPADCSGSDTTSFLDPAKLLQVGNDVQQLLVDIRHIAPHSKITLVGYGQLLTRQSSTPPGADPICGEFSSAERTDAFKVEFALDLALRVATTFAAIGDPQIKYVSPFAGWLGQRQPEFVGHSLCDGPVTTQWYHGYSALSDPAGQLAILHGNVSWHKAIANRLLATI